MTHIVLALVWLSAAGSLRSADIAVTQPSYVAERDCHRAAWAVYRDAVSRGVIPPRTPASFRFSCTTEL